MRNPIFIAVSGFFSSGSSAVVELLTEHDKVFECSAEIRFIKDPYGISQLENALVHNWELINSSAAIQDFRELCSKCARKHSRFPLAPFGLGYADNINHDFSKITEAYIQALTKHVYKRDYYHNKLKKGYLTYVVDRCLWAVEFYSNGKIKMANRHKRPLHFSKPTQEEFNTATKQYFNKLFKNQIDNDDINYIVLDQAISPNNTQVIHRYFENAKMIIVTRDPRDTYMTDIRWAVNLDNDLTSYEAGVRYGERQKALHENITVDEDIMVVRFEDLILKYDETVKEIEDFVGISSDLHIRKKTKLKPEVSIKNIASWRRDVEKYGDVFRGIKDTVPNLCIDLDNETLRYIDSVNTRENRK